MALRSVQIIVLPDWLVAMIGGRESWALAGEMQMGTVAGFCVGVGRCCLLAGLLVAAVAFAQPDTDAPDPVLSPDAVAPDPALSPEQIEAPPVEGVDAVRPDAALTPEQDQGEPALPPDAIAPDAALAPEEISAPPALSPSSTSSPD